MLKGSGDSENGYESLAHFGSFSGFDFVFKNPDLVCFLRGALKEESKVLWRFLYSYRTMNPTKWSFHILSLSELILNLCSASDSIYHFISVQMKSFWHSFHFWFSLAPLKNSPILWRKMLFPYVHHHLLEIISGISAAFDLSRQLMRIDWTCDHLKRYERLWVVVVPSECRFISVGSDLLCCLSFVSHGMMWMG